MIKKFNLKSTIKNALFVVILTANGTTAAVAQQTPATYCATLPATSCEVLNVEISACTATAGCLGTIKYCRNKNFQVVPIYGSINSSAGLTITDQAATLRGITYGNGTVSTAWTATQLCGYIP